MSGTDGSKRVVVVVLTPELLLGLLLGVLGVLGVLDELRLELLELGVAVVLLRLLELLCTSFFSSGNPSSLRASAGVCKHVQTMRGRMQRHCSYPTHFAMSAPPRQCLTVTVTKDGKVAFCATQKVGLVGMHSTAITAVLDMSGRIQVQRRLDILALANLHLQTAKGVARVVCRTKHKQTLAPSVRLAPEHDIVHKSPLGW